MDTITSVFLIIIAFFVGLAAGAQFFWWLMKKALNTIHF